MNSSPQHPDPQKRLVEAETVLARTVQRLRTLQRAALYGQYSAVEYDDAVKACVVARSEAWKARSAWHRWRAAQQSPSGGTAGAPTDDKRVTAVAPEAVERPTPRMLFVRWLVQTRRLTEWPKGRA